MRMLLAGDIHGNTSHARRLVRTAADAGIDRIVQLGDFGYWEHTPEGVRYLDDLHRAARDDGVTVYFVDGNHDKSSMILERYGEQPDHEGFLTVRGRIRYAPRGHRWTWDGTRFLAFGGAFSIDRDARLALERQSYEKALRRQAFRRMAGRPPVDVPTTAGTLWFPEEEATDDDVAAVLAQGDRIDVLLTHDKPHATEPVVNRKDYDECYPNQDRVQRLLEELRPVLAAHGHLHWRYTETVARADGGRTRVEGLAADPAACGYMAGYRVEHSWLVLDTAELDAQEPVAEEPDVAGAVQEAEGT